MTTDLISIEAPHRTDALHAILRPVMEQDGLIHSAGSPPMEGPPHVLRSPCADVRVGIPRGFDRA
jgi:hypothetical protein